MDKKVYIFKAVKLLIVVKLKIQYQGNQNLVRHQN